jgi:S1-C subfamily serine protease
MTLGVWAVAFLLAWWLVRGNGPGPLNDPSYSARAITARGDLAQDEAATIEIFRDASPSVVYITSSELRRSLFSLNVFEIPRGTGTGFIYDEQGHVVTNLHVVEEGSRWQVTLADQSQWDAKVVGIAPDKDLAVLKIDAPQEKLKPLPMGTSVNLQVGQKVFAIGNPFGLDRTLTTGVVSALGREIRSLTNRPIQDVIQTDAAINPGNSGGPLLDSAGRLVGINTQIASPTGAYVGIGFAVPVDVVNRVVPDLIRYGRVIRPGLGVVVASDYVTRQLGIERGVLLAEVPSDSPAAAAGLNGTYVRGRRIERLGDIIIRIGDTRVDDQYDLLDALEAHKVGEEVRVTYLRDGREHEVAVRLQAL